MLDGLDEHQVATDFTFFKQQLVLIILLWPLIRHESSHILALSNVIPQIVVIIMGNQHLQLAELAWTMFCTKGPPLVQNIVKVIFHIDLSTN